MLLKRVYKTNFTASGRYAYFPLRLLLVYIIAILVSVIAGCGYSVTNIEGKNKFAYDNVLHIKKGMHKDEVEHILGKPFTVGISKHGNIVYSYEWVKASKSAIYGGVGVIGESAVFELTGAEAGLEFFKDNNILNTFEYKIYGADNYDRLRGLKDVR